ncbi:MAG: hypothetical protein ACREEX_00875, partial [Caulobacteraceae bacterium]
WKNVFTAQRRAVMTASFLLVRGRLQRAGEVVHLVAERLEDLTSELAGLRLASVTPQPQSPDPRLQKSRNFH